MVGAGRAERPGVPDPLDEQLVDGLLLPVHAGGAQGEHRHVHVEGGADLPLGHRAHRGHRDLRRLDPERPDLGVVGERVAHIEGLDGDLGRHLALPALLERAEAGLALVVIDGRGGDDELRGNGGSGTRGHGVWFIL